MLTCCGGRGPNMVISVTPEQTAEQTTEHALVWR